MKTGHSTWTDMTIFARGHSQHEELSLSSSHYPFGLLNVADVDTALTPQVLSDSRFIVDVNKPI